MHSTKITALRAEYLELIDYCREHGQVSFEMYINNTYKKALLLSAASHFEFEISAAVHNFADIISKSNHEIISLVDNKAIKRQYHTYFKWDSNNANNFFGLFGDAFKQKMRLLIKDQNLEDAESAFLKLGNQRNELVHCNYAEYQLNDTFEEIYAKYETACKFVDFLIMQLQG